MYRECVWIHEPGRAIGLIKAGGRKKVKKLKNRVTYLLPKFDFQKSAASALVIRN